MGPLLIVVNSLSRPMREYLLRSISTEFRIWLLQDTAPGWELPYLVGHTVVDTLDPAAMLAVITSGDLSPGGVLCWDEVRVEAAAALAARLRLPGDPQAVHRCRDKHLTRTALAQAGVPQAASVAIGSLPEAAEAAQRIGYPVVLKPRALAGSYGVVLVAHPDRMAVAFAHANGQSIVGVPNFTKGILVEEYLHGEEVSVDCAVHDGVTTPVIVAHKKLGYSPYFEEVGHVVDAADPLLADPSVRSMLQAAHQAVELRDGWAHTELRFTSTGPKIVEINARLGGDLIPYLGLLASGVDPGLLAARVACGLPPVPVPSRWRAAGVVFGYPTCPCIAQRLQIEDDLLPPETDLVEFLVEPGRRIEPPPAGHVWGRFSYATVLADTMPQCQDRLEALAKAVTLVAEPDLT